jgi:predicted heme/steroid binding protein/uncharacterized membrane protein
MRRMTTQDMQAHNETESGSILIGFKGKVYDVSDSPLWQGGVHKKRHKAGDDLTTAIASAPHSEELLKQFPIVGELISESGQEPPKGLLKWLLNMHPHPVSVHFPIALIMTAAFLTILGWLLKSTGIMHAGFFNLILGTMATPVAYGTGYLSFHFNYKHKWTKTFRMKQILAIAVFIVAILAIISGSVVLSTITEPSFFRKVYLVLTVFLPPLVGATGYLGGTITFPKS